MNDKNLKARISELKSIWNSLEPDLRHDLERIDHRLRTIYSEARTFGVPKKAIEEYIQREFWRVAKEVTDTA